MNETHIHRYQLLIQRLGDWYELFDYQVAIQSFVNVIPNLRIGLNNWIIEINVIIDIHKTI